MIVISRNTTQSIVIGDEIRVTVIRIQGDRVRLGIEAPRECAIHRSEIFDLIQQAGRRIVRPPRERVRESDSEPVANDPWTIDGAGFHG